jgi:hypothetical protein
MTRPARFLLGGVLLGAVVAGFLWSCRGGERVAVDLVEEWPKAKQRVPQDSQSVIDASISGDTRKGILVTQPGRIAYDVTVPEHAWLKLAVGMLEKSWTIPGDGVTIFLYVVPLGPDGNVMTRPEGGMVSDELLSLTVNPSGNPADKLWHDLTLDLSKYAGKRVELRLVTQASPTNRTADTNGDVLVWGQPRIVVN